MLFLKADMRTNDLLFLATIIRRSPAILRPDNATEMRCRLLGLDLRRSTHFVWLSGGDHEVAPFYRRRFAISAVA